MGVKSIAKVVVGYKTVDSLHPAVFFVYVRLYDIYFWGSFNEIGKFDGVNVARVGRCCLLRDLESTLIDCFIFLLWLYWLLSCLAWRLFV